MNSLSFIYSSHFHSARIVSALPQPPPTPIGPILNEWLTTLFPEELSIDTFNSQYLQRHSTSAPAVLAVANVSWMLDASREELETILFATLDENVQLDIKVGRFAAHDAQSKTSYLHFLDCNGSHSLFD